MSLTFASLCGGHDGTGEGFINAGDFVGIGNFDLSEHALRFSKLNHPNIPTYQCDLLEVSGKWILKKIGKVNVLIITCPCQGISLANPKFDPNHPLNKLLIRCLNFIGFLDENHCGPDLIVCENVANLTRGEMRRLYNIILYHLRSLRSYRFCDGIINALHHDVCQDRDRWIALIMRREYGIPSMLLKTTIDEDALRIRNIDPSIEFITGGYEDENGNHHKIIRSKNEFCFTLTATPNAWQDTLTENDKPLSIPQVRKFCSYRENWIYDEDSYNKAYRLFGNSVMPKMSEAIATHIKKLLGCS